MLFPSVGGYMLKNTEAIITVLTQKTDGTN